MIVLECEQGSDAWHQARIGVITGSEFVTARAKYATGKQAGTPNAAAKNYAFKKAIERIGGKLLDDGFENWGMRRGHELEPAARREHEIQLGEIVHRCGFVTTDCGTYGCSLDGMIGHRHGGSEYKCFASPEKMRDILLDGDLSDVIDQVQGGIWVAELEWMDFCLYCPELEPAGNTLWHRRVYRDDVYIKALRADLKSFNELVLEYMDKVRKAMGGSAPVVAAPSSAPSLHVKASAPTFESLLAKMQACTRRIAADLVLDEGRALPPDQLKDLAALADKKFQKGA